MPTRRRQTREAHQLELTLEWVFEVPFDQLLAEAKRTRVCDEEDLLALGHRTLWDLVRLARGEIAGISIPHRLPRRGEHSRDRARKQ